MTITDLILLAMLLGAARLFYLVAKRAIKANQTMKRRRQAHHVRYERGCWP